MLRIKIGAGGILSIRDRLIADGIIRPGPQSSDAAVSPTRDAMTQGTDGVVELDETPVASEEPVSTTDKLAAGAIALPPNYHFGDSTDFEAQLLGKSASDFISRYILEPVPFAFKSDLDNWLQWKTDLAWMLQVDPKDIVLGGSGSIGFSLHPKKSLRAYTPKSDFDICIVSRHHFDVAWRTLRSFTAISGEGASEGQKAANSHRASHIYDGAISADKILSLFPFGKDWQSALDMLSGLSPTQGRTLKLRIYRDFESLRAYLLKGVRFWQAALGARVPDESSIAVET